MTEPTRAKAGRRNRRSASQLFMAALVVFGVVASVLLLFSENVQWLRVGVASALWAAIIGAFAMTKYRRESAADQTKTKDLQTVYELQLAREISARREYELGVEARVREQNKLETSEIAALRNELAALRNNLQVLFEGNLPTERIALRAEAVRLQELAGRSYEGYQPAPSGLYIPGGAPQGAAQNVGAPRPSDMGSAPGMSTQFDEPVTAETSVIYPDISRSDPLDQERSPRSDQGNDQERSPRSDQEQQGWSPRSGSRDQVRGRRNGTSEDAAPNQPYRRVESERATEPASSIEDRVESRRPTPFSGYKYGESRPPRAGAESMNSKASEPAQVQSAHTVSTPVPVVPQPFLDAQPIPKQDPQPVPEPEPQPEPQPVLEPEARAVDEPEPARSDYEAAPDSSIFEAEEATVVPDVDPTPRRRRRAEDSEPGPASGAHSNGRSVADILAGMQSGSSEPSARRHRRRAE